MTAVLATGHAFRFKAKGWSMTPFIRDGDVISIVPITMDRCRLGEVVAFTRPETGHLVVHRIIGGTGRDYLIQGDSAVDETDGIISHDQLLGKVSRVERDGRCIWLGQGLGRVFIAWLSRRGYLAHLRLRPDGFAR
jgi:phage repressor protein C with HTH and peptisase S24 domain